MNIDKKKLTGRTAQPDKDKSRRLEAVPPFCHVARARKTLSTP
jgi:hypothetical protein